MFSQESPTGSDDDKLRAALDLQRQSQLSNDPEMTREANDALLSLIHSRSPHDLQSGEEPSPYVSYAVPSDPRKQLAVALDEQYRAMIDKNSSQIEVTTDWINDLMRQIDELDR